MTSDDGSSGTTPAGGRYPRLSRHAAQLTRLGVRCCMERTPTHAAARTSRGAGMPKSPRVAAIGRASQAQILEGWLSMLESTLGDTRVADGELQQQDRKSGV